MLSSGANAVTCVPAPRPVPGPNVKWYPLSYIGDNKRFLANQGAEAGIPEAAMTYTVELSQLQPDKVTISLKNVAVPRSNPPWYHYVYQVKFGNLDLFYFLDGKDSCTIEVPTKGIDLRKDVISRANLFWLQ